MKKFVAMLMTGALMGLGLSVSAAPAQADDSGLCLVTPERTKTVEHDAVTQYESRWKKDIQEVKEVSHVETKFYRDIPKVDATYKTLNTFYRVNPGQDETFTTWYKWQKTVPTEVKEYRYKKVIPGSEGVKECQYKKWVKDTKEESRYMYQKKVSGDVYKDKEHGNDQKVGTFDWEWWQPPTWNGGPLTHWGAWGNDAATEDSGPHSSVSNTYTSGDDTLYKKSTQYKYFRTDQKETRTVDNGGHWEYQWATEDPGEGWTKTGDCRWKVEPVEEKTLWAPSEDGWTKDILGAPWVQVADRTVPGPDDIVLYNDGQWTKDVLGAPWVKTDEESRSNHDGVEPFREYKTANGITLVEAEAYKFDESSFEGWLVLDTYIVKVTDEVPGYREYLGEGDNTSKDIDDAVWRLEDAVEGWSVLETRTVVTTEYQAGYTIYYNPDGEPTLTLTDVNWTKVAPGGDWVFVDERDLVLEKAWTEKIVTPAVYEDCKVPASLAFTGATDEARNFALIVGGLAILIGAGSVFYARRRRA